jgi:hypothetical protein
VVPDFEDQRFVIGALLAGGGFQKAKAVQPFRCFDAANLQDGRGQVQERAQLVGLPASPG